MEQEKRKRKGEEGVREWMKREGGWLEGSEELTGTEMSIACDGKRRD